MIDEVSSHDSFQAAFRVIKDLELFEGQYFILPEDLVIDHKKREGRSLVKQNYAPFIGNSDKASLIPSEMSGLSKIDSFRESISGCMSCELGGTRRNFVFGSGSNDADIMFIGEAPGEEEDRTGKPFVGPAGELLNKIIEAMHLTREDVYICNILKCRPPNNRDPLNSEIETCEPYLVKQIELIGPRVICALGRFAAQTLLRSNESMGRLRLATHSYKGIPVVATYHPAALLRNPQWKRPTWEDMKKVRRLCDGVDL
ncbi:MAG: uracil-DNA glycosylase family protein [Candidatus Latescibacterota bacterium]|nr:uracil-DNA glycosylase family protein [Candidatus Latescibacterota bacterium]